MILIINICREKLHYYEFVKPICDILEIHGIKYNVKNYKEVKESDLIKAGKVIICGTSLYDNDFINYIDKFRWILEFNKPILGICGGMQIIGILFGGKLKKKTEIDFYMENFKEEFLGAVGEMEVYHLHNYFIDFSKLDDFMIFNKGNISQAVKHKEKQVYGVLFHPEVRNKEMVLNFIKLQEGRFNN